MSYYKNKKIAYLFKRYKSRKITMLMKGFDKSLTF